jgi:regulator of sirC expression with transglutaminase-like and TPR domain
MAQAAANAGDNLRALNETEKSLQLRPDWETAAIARAQIQARHSGKTAIDSLGDFVDHHPNASEARLTLARLLIAEKRYTESRQHFDRLVKDNPDNPEVIYPVAMLALQNGDTATGRNQLENLLRPILRTRAPSTFSWANSTRSRKNRRPPSRITSRSPLANNTSRPAREPPKS